MTRAGQFAATSRASAAGSRSMTSAPATAPSTTSSTCLRLPEDRRRVRQGLPHQRNRPAADQSSRRHRHAAWASARSPSSSATRKPSACSPASASTTAKASTSAAPAPSTAPNQPPPARTRQLTRRLHPAATRRERTPQARLTSDPGRKGNRMPAQDPQPPPDLPHHPTASPRPHDDPHLACSDYCLGLNLRPTLGSTLSGSQMSIEQRTVPSVLLRRFLLASRRRTTGTRVVPNRDNHLANGDGRRRVGRCAAIPLIELDRHHAVRAGFDGLRHLKHRVEPAGAANRNRGHPSGASRRWPTLACRSAPSTTDGGPDPTRCRSSSFAVR